MEKNSMLALIQSLSLTPQQSSQARTGASNIEWSPSLDLVLPLQSGLFPSLPQFRPESWPLSNRTEHANTNFIADLVAQWYKFCYSVFDLWLRYSDTAHALRVWITFSTVREVQAEVFVANICICLVKLIKFSDLRYRYRRGLIGSTEVTGTGTHRNKLCEHADTLTNKTMSKLFLLMSQYCLVKLQAKKNWSVEV